MTTQLLKLQIDKDKLLEDKVRLQNENSALEHKNTTKDKTIANLQSQVDQHKPLLDQKDQEISEYLKKLSQISKK